MGAKRLSFYVPSKTTPTTHGHANAPTRSQSKAPGKDVSKDPFEFALVSFWGLLVPKTDRFVSERENDPDGGSPPTTLLRLL